MGISWLDVKLGLRMLVRYPGLSIAGGLAIAIVVVCGTAAGIFHAVVNSELPFEDGDRIVIIENWDTGLSQPAPHDFERWRSELTMIADVGAFRLVHRNIAAPGLAPEPARVAEISPAAFRIAGAQPLLGRALTEEDDRPAAPRVIVIGEDEWRRRFAGDMQIAGRTITVGGTTASIVGVMPRGFGFPVNERYWVPLRFDPAQHGPDTGAPSGMPFKQMAEGALHVFGRLADGSDLDAAQAEAAVLGRRADAGARAAAGEIRARVMPYTRWYFSEWHDGEIYLNQALVLLLLGIVGANVAVLVYARTAARRIEIAVRSALGASRARIAAQLFAEGLVLSGFAALLGWLAAALLRSELDGLIPWQLAPFWVNSGAASGMAAAYVLALAVAGAVIVGVIPALQATSRRAQTGLQHAAAAGSSWKVGRTYGALIVVQVTLAVAILPYALSSSWTSVRGGFAGAGFDADRYLTARIEMDGASASAAPSAVPELVRQLESEPGVQAAALLAGVPGHEPLTVIEVEGEDELKEIRAGRMGPGFARVFDVPVLAGRGFSAPDFDAGARHAVVNRTFAREVLGGEALGRRLRRITFDNGTQSAHPWFEVVGIVEDFPASAPVKPIDAARLYFPAPATESAGLMAVRLRGADPSTFAPRLRSIATAISAALLLQDVQPMDALLRRQQTGARIGALVSVVVTASLLLLSATGMYALMAFTVTQRRREIGIRVALGADRRRLLSGILSRALRQLALGIVAGVSIVAIWDAETGGELTGGAGPAILPLVAAFVLLVGILAAAAPARRALRIEPTEALKEG